MSKSTANVEPVLLFEIQEDLASMATSLSFDVLHPQPLLIVISGPSGVGKDAVVKRMKEVGLPFHFVVTATSRAPRVGEQNGVDYHFITREAFKKMIDENELLEYANVYNDYKGIPKAQIRQAMESGLDVVLRVDVQGAAKLRSLCPEAVLIFLVPANEAEWYSRLLDRKTETDESLRIRTETALVELERVQMFDYVVVNANDRLDDAVEVIRSIIQAEHHKVNPRKITL